jgi:hypothetical protein
MFNISDSFLLIVKKDLEDRWSKDVALRQVGGAQRGTCSGKRSAQPLPWLAR